MKRASYILGMYLSAFCCLPANADEGDVFHFEAVGAIDDMRALVRSRFPAGTPGEHVRDVFVDQGHATRLQHPTQIGVEKYIYDINLCRYYVWRWNISVDYDADDRVVEMYVNGEPVFGNPASAEEFDPDEARDNGTLIALMTRARPEADRGENTLSYVLIDADRDRETIDDQRLAGAGPTRPDPLNMGRLHSYYVDLWRSIFDSDEADFIAPYRGDCEAVDAAMRAR